ncbi:hypothetical protein [Pseudomonas sp. RIT623]|uniref:hypothetical protein n=1 Tax=Pseudomonas sp. RIT623 TaxID=2559075 RepID=UPI00106FC0A6|nr:hypothetical protein [Pseudomonas sp. RIT623]TFF38136.1 hypothetical protein E3U47_16975 [Pseudomonas sp. RIT623]
MTDPRIIDAINSHAADIQNISCILGGLLQQLRDTQGVEGLDRAKDFAIQAAKSLSKPGAVSPDIAHITKVFDQHR